MRKQDSFEYEYCSNIVNHCHCTTIYASYNYGSICDILTGVGSDQARVLSDNDVGIRSEAAGTYICRAENALGSTEVTLSVTVQGKGPQEHFYMYAHVHTYNLSKIPEPSGPNSRVFLRFSTPTFEDRFVRAFEGITSVEQFLPFLNGGVSFVLFIIILSGVILHLDLFL